ncbi:MAG: hypothetical protein KF754_14685 [Planctomycetes bacterium]|nr:hypothetical protein [Planctomycetota bacterium]
MTLFYQLSLAGDDLEVTTTINGFPLHTGPLDGSMGTVLNPFLVGAGNQLKIEFGRRGPAAVFVGALQCVRQGEVVSTQAAGEFSMPAGNELVHRFDSETAAFAPTLIAARKAAPAELLPLAIAVRDLLRRRDTPGLMRLLEPKLACYAEAFGAPRQNMEDDIARGLSEFFGSDLDFEPADLLSMPWCEDRVFSVSRRDGSPLVRKETAEGSMSLQVFGAMLPGGPAIVA